MVAGMKIVEKLAARTNAAGAHAPVLIGFIGDSVTHGCFEVYMDHRREIGVVYEPDSGYPYRLKRCLETLYPAAAVSILNAGVSAEKAADGAKRIERDILSRKPDLVVIAFGLNDAMNPDRAAGLAEFRNAMADMVSRTLRSGAECIVQTPSFMCSYVPSALRDAELIEIAQQAVQVQTSGTLAEYAEAAREVAQSCGAAISDAFRCWTRLEQSGVDTTALLSNHINHPTRAAHDIFVSTLMDAILA